MSLSLLWVRRMFDENVPFAKEVWDNRDGRGFAYLVCPFLLSRACCEKSGRVVF